MKQNILNSSEILPVVKICEAIPKGKNLLLGYLVLLILLASANQVRSQSVVYETTGVADNLPVFYKKIDGADGL